MHYDILKLWQHKAVKNLQSFNLTEFLGLEIDYLNWKNHI